MYYKNSTLIRVANVKGIFENIFLENFKKLTFSKKCMKFCNTELSVKIFCSTVALLRVREWSAVDH